MRIHNLLLASFHLLDKKSRQKCVSLDFFCLEYAQVMSSGITRGMSCHDREEIMLWLFLFLLSQLSRLHPTYLGHDEESQNIQRTYRERTAPFKKLILDPSKILDGGHSAFSNRILVETSFEASAALFLKAFRSL